MNLIKFLNLKCPLLDTYSAINTLKKEFNLQNAEEIYYSWRKDYIENNFKNDDMI